MTPFGPHFSPFSRHRGQTTSAFFSAISCKNAVKVCPQFLHKTSIVGSLIVFSVSCSISGQFALVLMGVIPKPRVFLLRDEESRMYHFKLINYDL